MAVLCGCAQSEENTVVEAMEDVVVEGRFHCAAWAGGCVLVGGLWLLLLPVILVVPSGGHSQVIGWGRKKVSRIGHASGGEK